MENSLCSTAKFQFPFLHVSNTPPLLRKREEKFPAVSRPHENDAIPPQPSTVSTFIFHGDRQEVLLTTPGHPSRRTLLLSSSSARRIHTSLRAAQHACRKENRKFARWIFVNTRGGGGGEWEKRTEPRVLFQYLSMSFLTRSHAERLRCGSGSVPVDCNEKTTCFSPSSLLFLLLAKELAHTQTETY